MKMTNDCMKSIHFHSWMTWHKILEKQEVIAEFISEIRLSDHNE